MRCDYCFYLDEMTKRNQCSRGFMTEQTLKNVIRKTMPQAQGQISYAFQGGEPTLRGLDFFRKAVQYQKQYNHNGIQVTNVLQTNGFALDEAWCRFFKENNFLIGVSVDGTRQIHDSLRHSAGGEETYDRVCASIELLEKFGVEYNILTVVTEELARNGKAVYETYARNGWKYQQYIECLDPLGELRGSSPYSLSPKSYGIFLTELFELWYRDLQAGRHPYNRRFENYVGILLGRRPESCEQCGQCGVQFVVEADGSAYPCDFYMLDPYCLGNFNEDRLPQMDLQREKIGFIARSRQLAKACRQCQYYEVCRGGCQRSREYVEQQQGYLNYFCEGYSYFFDHCLGRLKEIADHLR